MTEIKVAILNPEIRGVLVKTIPDDHKVLQSSIGSDCFDIVQRSIGGRRLNCVVDDMGLFRDKVIPSVATADGDVLLVGTVLLAGLTDHEGNMTSLTE